MGVFGFRPDVHKLETERDTNGLIKALQYQDADVRLAAAKSLSNFCSADACPALITCLKDEDGQVRDASIATLVAMGEISLPLLFNAMGDQSWRVRQGSAAALSRLRWNPDDDEIKVCFLFAQGAWRELTSFGKKAIPYLVEGLKDENPESIRIVTMKYVSKVMSGIPKDGKPKDPNVKAAWALGRFMKYPTYNLGMAPIVLACFETVFMSGDD